MNYQKEYAVLVGQVDKAVSLLELCAWDEPLVRRAADVLVEAIREAEEHYVALADAV